jgi:hypothetical protein
MRLWSTNVQTLREMQLAFCAEVFANANTELPDVIRANELGSARRVQVYRNNVHASLTEALRAVYPVIYRLLGDGFFRHAAHHYIYCYPSRSGNLHDFGRSFARFLSGFPGARGLYYLPDVARLEWAYHRVFHAAHAEPRNLSRLARVPVEQHGAIRFTLPSASRLLISPYPILRIWQVNQEGYNGDQQVDLREGGVKLLVIRRELNIEIETLADGEFALLQAFKHGCCLDEAFERALAVEPELDTAACLQRHVVNHTVVDFSLATNLLNPSDNGGEVCTSLHS